MSVRLQKQQDPSSPDLSGFVKILEPRTRKPKVDRSARHRKHRKNLAGMTVRNDPLLPEKVLSLWSNANQSISSICTALGASYYCVRGILELHNVYERGRRSLCLSRAAHPASRLTEQEWEQLESDLRAGGKHSELARKYGVSRERIRQIACKLGTPTGRQVCALARQHREQQLIEEKSKLKEQKAGYQERHLKEELLPLQTMWEQGSSISAMAEFAKTTVGAMSVRIVKLRKERGWFPRRRNNWRARYRIYGFSDPVLAKLRDGWDAGLSREELAVSLGMSEAAVLGMISSIRTVDRLAFPFRRKAASLEVSP